MPPPSMFRKQREARRKLRRRSNVAWFWKFNVLFVIFNNEENNIKNAGRDVFYNFTKIIVALWLCFWYHAF